MHAIDGYSQEISLVIAARNKCSIWLPLSWLRRWCIEYPHILDLSGKSNLIDKIEWILVPNSTLENFILFDELLAENEHFSRVCIVDYGGIILLLCTVNFAL